MSSISDNAPTNPPDLSDKLPRLTPRKPTTAQEPESPIPAPATPPLPPPITSATAATADDSNNSQPWHFRKPRRRILSPHDHALFRTSPTHTLLQAFIFTLADSVTDTPVSAIATQPPHPTIAGILDVLDGAEALLARCPPEDTGSRFGNPAFRAFVAGVEAEQERWHARLGVTRPAAVEELSAYLAASFGDPARIDYGSGHELNFFCWLLCLYQLSLLSSPEDDKTTHPSTFPQLVLRVFPRYLRLMRRVQTTYYLEPAGSHGVWGLDDYQFLPFLFGAAQLLGHRYVRPKSIHSALVLEECAPDYLYLDQVAFVNGVKNVEGLRWHSPMLDDISAARSWRKIEGGMRKMFVAEVLGKLPVMQHFLFGSLIPAVEEMSDEEVLKYTLEGEPDAEGNVVVRNEDGESHKHNPASWNDCCGIKVPSAVGALQEMKKRMGNEGLRRVPFD
ncbi:serine threonine-protein phosphatase 2a activator 2 [Diplodia corticola]|uniref:Serine/threonine-protein phosphatase 2A activator n=1 Tax=Diplodia corticola TaxID=236234 RepID=A0A1J9RP04_9PEZI|nr:serine threonine-protein phosphatase 2a activator 2 [Diplodia corticola]OJD34283.1 serine threonine-protein phosphatase 2a activator 2 [Diplodia corticola]